jgi:sulfite exporter TauE/SafE
MLTAGSTNLWLIFITGLTTGGLSCLAIQGGLLATAMTKQVQVKAKRKHRKDSSTKTAVQLTGNLWPVVAFLAAKLLAYTLLGLLLGALGAAFQITPPVQAGMQILAGFFLLGTALNMLNVHPIFRHFALQPPYFLTKMIRDQSKSETLFTPALLGFMTIFIPCGTTQAMMVLAISTANALLGAAIMAAFTLGTSPTFMVLGFLATQIKGKLRKTFAAATAVLILLLGFFSMDAGLKLVGSPIAPSRVVTSLFTSGANVAQAAIVNGTQIVAIDVLNTAYVPNNISVRAGIPTRLVMQTQNTGGCTLAFTIPSLGIQEILPFTGSTFIDLPALEPGPVYFTCSMGMYGGVINVVEG